MAHLRRHVICHINSNLKLQKYPYLSLSIFVVPFSLVCVSLLLLFLSRLVTHLSISRLNPSLSSLSIFVPLSLSPLIYVSLFILLSLRLCVSILVSLFILLSHRLCVTILVSLSSHFSLSISSSLSFQQLLLFFMSLIQ